MSKDPQFTYKDGIVINFVDGSNIILGPHHTDPDCLIIGTAANGDAKHTWWSFGPERTERLLKFMIKHFAKPPKPGQSQLDSLEELLKTRDEIV